MASTRWRWCSLFVILLALKLGRVSPSQDVMKKLTAQFSDALDKCKDELNVAENIMQDFYNFWRMDYNLVNREMGCVIMCMVSKFDLITEDLKIHHGNAAEFAKKHGADENTAKQLATIIHNCEEAYKDIGDECSRVLEIAKCFRTKIHELKWAPDMEVVLEEVMTEL